MRAAKAPAPEGLRHPDQGLSKVAEVEMHKLCVTLSHSNSTLSPGIFEKLRSSRVATA